MTPGPPPSRQPPHQQAPPVQRLRVRYAKRGRARFTSHRDFGRAFERALRRAGVPMAYSSGFSPHPRISYANAAPTGAATEAEYLEIGLAETCDPDKVRAALDAALPPGLDVLEVVVSPPGALADQLTASRWRADLPGRSADAISAAADRLLAEPEVIVQRMTKSGLRDVDARAAVLGLHPGEARLEMTLEHTVPLVRPDDVLAGIARLTPEAVPPEGVVLTRLVQGRFDPGTGTVVPPGG